MDGLDFAWSKPSVSAILAGGYRFVCRYLSWDTTGKNLTYAEAQSYLSNGIGVVSNWEYSANAAANGRGQGVSDATEGARQHTSCGGPPDAPIYFSVDFDVPSSQYGAVASYFDGVASVIGLARTGAYGGYPIINYLFNNGRITYGWQTFAWSSGRWDGRAQLRQVQNGITVGGADCDHDVSMVDNFGQWGADMALTDADLNAIATRVWGLLISSPSLNTTLTAGDWLKQPTANDQKFSPIIDSISSRIDRILADLSSPTPVVVDADQVAQALIDNPQFLAALANAVNSDAGARLSKPVPTATPATPPRQAQPPASPPAQQAAAQQPPAQQPPAHQA